MVINQLTAYNLNIAAIQLGLVKLSSQPLMVKKESTLFSTLTAIFNQQSKLQKLLL